MRTAILRIRGFFVPWVERKLLAVADGAQPICGNTERDQIRTRRHGATFTRREFREWLGSAGLVRVELLEPLPFTEVMLARKEGPT